jgi:cobalt/nickel transport system permease protein
MSLNPQHVTSNNSLLARRDARWRIAAVFVACAAVAALKSVEATAASLVLALILAGLSGTLTPWHRVRLGLLVLGVVPFVVVVPFVADRGERIWEWHFLAVTDEGIQSAVALALRTVALVLIAMSMLASTPLHVTLCAARKLGLPRLLVHVSLLTYRYTFLLVDELNRLRIALRVRGFRNAMTGHAYRTIGRVTGTLLVRGSDRAERVAAAMRCRGFDGHFRTLAAFRTTFPDVLMFALIAAAAGGLAAWDVWG